MGRKLDTCGKVTGRLLQYPTSKELEKIFSKPLPKRYFKTKINWKAFSKPDHPLHLLKTK